jgi:glycosyltransferase involved in cell wall biosynthesis
MPSAIPQPSDLKLSICIATLNRAAFIGATLESILSQLTDDCEVVVLDGASTDDTERVVSEYTRRFDHLRYIRQDTNNGIDRDYDRVVDLARGEYCWLMTDDDLLKPGAVVAVLEALCRDVSLVIVNVEFRNFNMSKVLQRRWLDFESDRMYRPREMDRLFAEVDDIAMYVGSVVLKRTIWLARERERYYGSLFIHVGVIFQERLPGKALVIAEPFISYRTGNAHTYSPELTEMLFVKWPSLVESLALSESARRKVRSAEPWRNPRWLLLLRGLGLYSLTEYRRWVRPRLSSTRETLIPTFVALLPSVAVNAFLVSYYFARQDQGRWLQAMRDSPLHPRNWRVFKRES